MTPAAAAPAAALAGNDDSGVLSCVFEVNATTLATVGFGQFSGFGSVHVCISLVNAWKNHSSMVDE